MNLALIIAGITAVVAGGIGLAVRSSRKAWLRPEDRLWVIGDSLGVGLLPQLIKLGDRDGIQTYGVPVGGTNIRQWATKLGPQAIRDANATAVLVVLGSNDAAASEDYVTKQAPYYAHQLVRELEAEGLKVWWLAPGETGALARSKEIRAMLAAMAFAEGIEEHEVPDWIPYSPFDNIHPTMPAGYQALASWIWDTMTQVS